MNIFERKQHLGNAGRRNHHQSALSRRKLFAVNSADYHRNVWVAEKGGGTVNHLYAFGQSMRNILFRHLGRHAENGCGNTAEIKFIKAFDIQLVILAERNHISQSRLGFQSNHLLRFIAFFRQIRENLATNTFLNTNNGNFFHFFILK